MNVHAITVAELRAILADQPDNLTVAVRCCSSSDIAHRLEHGTWSGDYTGVTFEIAPKVRNGMLVLPVESDYVNTDEEDDDNDD